MEDQHQSNGKRGLEGFSPWLAGLNLVSTAERGLMVACAALSISVLIAMLTYIGWWQALLLITGHGLLFLVTVSAAPRQWTWRLLGLIVLSLTHVFAFVLLRVPGMDIVALVYVVIGLSVIVRYFNKTGCANRHLPLARTFTSRDDFRWLVTTAPLATRLKLHNIVRKAI